jgi:hypothetical protein
MATYLGEDGFRRAACPLCRQEVFVTSLIDDTRWRYDHHPSLADPEQWCPTSGELIPPDPGFDPLYLGM